MRLFYIVTEYIGKTLILKNKKSVYRVGEVIFAKDKEKCRKLAIERGYYKIPERNIGRISSRHETRSKKIRIEDYKIGVLEDNKNYTIDELKQKLVAEDFIKYCQYHLNDNDDNDDWMDDLVKVDTSEMRKI
jgi:hypothetical protein